MPPNAVNAEVLRTQITQKKGRKSMKKRRLQHSTDEVMKRKALKSCFKTVEVARNQLKDLIFQLKKQYHVELESYEAFTVKFLEIPVEQDMTIWFLVDHLKKFFVVAKQMLKEHSHQNDYSESIKSASLQISQLLEILKLTAMLLTGDHSPKKGYPSLPEDLNTESSRSKRQNRDYLFVKEYKKFLETVEEQLKKF